LDVFLRSKVFQVVKNPKVATGLAECFDFGSKVEIDEMHLASGGGGTNCATTLARAGRKAGWVGILGKDVFSQIEGESGYSNILLTPSGQRTILVYRGVSDDWQKIKMPWGKIKANWLYLTSLGGDLGMLSRILDFAEEHAINIAINPGARELALGWEKLKELLERVHILILNREEAAKLANKPYKNLAAIYERLMGLAQQVVVITEGARGATACNGSTCYRVGTYPVKVVDATGAGDAFGSGFVAEFMKKGNIEKALQYAAWNSSNVVNKIGAKAGIVREFPKKKLPVKMIEI